MHSDPVGGTVLGFVAIGRNEGQRLADCLAAITKYCPESPIVYVDSGSSDESVAKARSIGAVVVELDMSTPFTAARARNAGYAELISRWPDLQYIQFFDGDCEMEPDWIPSALQILASDSSIAVVSGRRSEKYPQNTIFNMFMDVEWDTPVGDTKAVLGDMCVRRTAFDEVNGFDPTIIAAEDDEFCLRVGIHGHRIVRIDAPMTRHDANITALSQWLRRAKRAGHGYANLNNLYRDSLGYFNQEVARAIIWGGLVPLLFLSSILLYPVLSVLILIGYCMLIARAGVRLVRDTSLSKKHAVLYALLLYVSKTYELQGYLQYWLNKIFSRKHKLIEYK